eukprot:365057-Chlamydomonas_euryale.AAC.24
MHKRVLWTRFACLIAWEPGISLALAYLNVHHGCVCMRIRTRVMNKQPCMLGAYIQSLVSHVNLTAIGTAAEYVCAACHPKSPAPQFPWASSPAERSAGLLSQLHVPTPFPPRSSPARPLAAPWLQTTLPLAPALAAPLAHNAPPRARLHVAQRPPADVPQRPH